MDRFSNSCREVAQNGRRGALMLTCSVHHPDIETFIKIKHDKTRVTGANISIRFSDEFMKAVESGGEYQQRWPVDSSSPKVSGMFPARKIWRMAIESAHKSAEPGAQFEDTMWRDTPADVYESHRTTSSNPCGEINMGRDSCRLMLLNTASYVKNPFTKKAYFDFDLFEEKARKYQRLMDDLVEIEVEKMDKILEKIDSDPEDESTKKIEKDMWLSLPRTDRPWRRPCNAWHKIWVQKVDRYDGKYL